MGLFDLPGPVQIGAGPGSHEVLLRKANVCPFLYRCFQDLTVGRNLRNDVIPDRRDTPRPLVKSPLLAPSNWRTLLPIPALPTPPLQTAGKLQNRILHHRLQQSLKPTQGAYTELQGLCQLPALRHDPESTTLPCLHSATPSAGSCHLTAHGV